MPGRLVSNPIYLSVCAGDALQVSVPLSPVRAQPGSDVLLGCNFSMAMGSVDLQRLVVQWRLGGQLVAEYDDTPSYHRAGARLSEEELQHGNASLLLPRVWDTDAGLYTCSIIYTPNHWLSSLLLKINSEGCSSTSQSVCSIVLLFLRLGSFPLDLI
uniref:Ig-like domain-containing protein n=1 Tax=Pelusios castaneus TaxID=367368 RepID=A0A8C8S299_9SAUR